MQFAASLARTVIEPLTCQVESLQAFRRARFLLNMPED